MQKQSLADVPQNSCKKFWKIHKKTSRVSYKKDVELKAPTQEFPCEHCKTFKSTYFEEHLRAAASKYRPDTTQKMKFSIKDFFSKCDQIRSFLRIWSHLLKKSLMEKFIFCAFSAHALFFSHTISQDKIDKLIHFQKIIEDDII